MKGAVIGGVAGHFAGHHGLLGAGAGCVIGRHEAKKHERERERAHQTNGVTTRVMAAARNTGMAATAIDKPMRRAGC